MPVYSPDLTPEELSRDRVTDWRNLSSPIHHLESVCAFGTITLTAPALALCWEHGVAVQNSRNSLLRAAREANNADDVTTLESAIEPWRRQVCGNAPVTFCGLTLWVDRSRPAPSSGARIEPAAAFRLRSPGPISPRSTGAGKN